MQLWIFSQKLNILTLCRKVIRHNDKWLVAGIDKSYLYVKSFRKYQNVFCQCFDTSVVSVKLTKLVHEPHHNASEGSWLVSLPKIHPFDCIIPSHWVIWLIWCHFAVTWLVISFDQSEAPVQELSKSLRVLLLRSFCKTTLLSYCYQQIIETILSINWDYLVTKSHISV